MQENAQFFFLKGYVYILRGPKKAFYLLAFLGFCALASRLLAAEDAGTRLYQQEAYSEARAFYEKRLQSAPKNPYLQYNLGCVAYQEGDYAKAQETFEAALHATDPGLQAQAFYNLGNTHFQQANTPGLPANTAIEALKKAITAYTNSLSLAPDNPKAKANLDLAQQELDRMQEQEQARQDSASPAQEPEKEPEGPEQKQDKQPQDTGSQQPQDSGEGNETSASQEKEKQKAPRNASEGNESSTPSAPPTHPAEASSHPEPEARDTEASILQSSPQEAAEPSAQEQRLQAILEASKKQEKKLHLQHLGSGGAAPRAKQVLKDW